MHAFGGVQWHLHKRLFATFELRYVWADARLERDFVDFEPIDLAGARTSGGIGSSSREVDHALRRHVLCSPESTAAKGVAMASRGPDRAGAAGPGAPLVAHQTAERWGPWLGCWELEPQAADEVPVPAIRTCVTRTASDPGVLISTTVAGAAPVEETFVADGAEWPIEDGPCRGMRRAEWSRTGHRLFSRARIECTGSPPYTVSHLATIAGDTWLDIQGITREAHEAVRVRRYRASRTASPFGDHAFRTPRRRSPSTM